jgi:hypothetical protein
MSKHIGLLLIAALGVGTAYSTPVLQLDIRGGTYDPATETIVTKDETFTLYALLNLSNVNDQAEYDALLAGDYYLSAALTPVTSDPGDLGSFSIDGLAVDATSDMVFGTPPFEDDAVSDPGDLSKGGVFDTYFYELAFNFDGVRNASVYNSQDNPGGLNPVSSGDLYYQAFEVSASGLNSEVGLHFNLYSSEVHSGGDVDVDKFAPFSHDAELVRVPEPAIASFLGLGFFAVTAFALFGRRRQDW